MEKYNWFFALFLFSFLLFGCTSDEEAQKEAIQSGINVQVLKNTDGGNLQVNLYHFTKDNFSLDFHENIWGYNIFYSVKGPNGITFSDTLFMSRRNDVFVFFPLKNLPSGEYHVFVNTENQAPMDLLDLSIKKEPAN